MSYLPTLFFATVIVSICTACSTEGGIRQPSKFANTLGYGKCRVYGPLSREQALIRATKESIRLPNASLDELIAQRGALGEIYFFDCTTVDTSRVVVGHTFFGLVKDGVVISKAAESIVD